MRWITAADLLTMPWKDGGGQTTQIAIHPPDADVKTGFDWRLSMARVEQDGPFSIFEGVDRHLVLLDGEGMILHGDGDQDILLRKESPPFTFAGEARVVATRVQGPCLDLGLMVRRDWGSGVLRSFRVGAAPICLESGGIRLLYAPEGGVHIGGQRLGPGEACLWGLEEPEVWVHGEMEGVRTFVGLLQPCR